MDSWSYVSEGKGFLSSDIVSSPGSIARSKNLLDFKTPCSYGSNMMASSHGNNGPGELGYPESVRKQLSDDSIKEVFSRNVSRGSIVDQIMMTQSAFSGEEKSKLSTTIVESNVQDALLIDLKLGRLADQRESSKSKFHDAAPVLCLTESSRSAKRVRPTGLSSQTAFCQVHGCNKDLSSSKEYHRRHKVCAVHSKTSQVIVNGIEQRFCQQCSRFHLLPEFDDGKRSCRKRLAGHNERRRKPQVGVQHGRAGELLQSYNALAGSRAPGSSVSATSILGQNTVTSGLLYHEQYGTLDWCKRVKVEDGTYSNPQSAIPIIKGHTRSKFLVPSNDFEKQFPTFDDNGNFNEDGARYSHNLRGSNSGSHSLFTDTSLGSLGSDHLTIFNNTPTIQGFMGISDSGCALSLLSSQSQSSPGRSSGIPIPQPLSMLGSPIHYSMNQVSGKLAGISTLVLHNEVLNKSAEGNQMCPMLLSDANFENSDRIFHNSDYVNTKDQLSCDDGSDNLLQLSSQLQRAEHHTQSRGKGFL